MRRPRLILFPGLGGDGRMYDGLVAALPLPVLRPGFSAPEPGDSIATYAARFAGLVRPGDLVGGSSFGGFVALELARQSRAAGVALIGSGRSCHEVQPLLPRLAPLADLISARLWHARPGAMLGGWLIGGTAYRRFRVLFVSMVRRTPPAFLHWACRSAAAWPGVADPGVPVRHVHGSADHIFPLARVRPDVVVPRAGHLLALTHPAAVAAGLAPLVARGA